MHIRNKLIAHNDLTIPSHKVYKANGITPNQIRKVIDETCDIVNYVASDLGISNRIFESNRLEQATLACLRRSNAGKSDFTVS